MQNLKAPEARIKMNDTKNQNQRGWRFDHRVNLSVLIQLAFLASLIVGSWVNLQSQLNLLQHDVTALLQSQKSFEQKLESLQAKSVSYEYRLRMIEKQLPEANVEDKSY
jgi:Tfp pilus assembly protein PilO